MTIKSMYFKTALFAAAGAFVLTGCDDDDAAQLRVIHASPDAPAVNVKLDSRERISNLDYAHSSGYLEVGTGNDDITVEAIIPGGNADVISVPGFGFAKDVRYNIIAVDNTADIEPLVVNESAATPGAGEVAVAVVHASPDAPPVDVYVTAPGTDVSDVNVLPNFSFDFKDPAVDAGNLPAGIYDITVTLAGTKTVAYNISDVDLSPFAGQKLMLVAVSTTTDTNKLASPVKLLVATDTTQLVLLDEDTQTGARVLHLSPDADAVAAMTVPSGAVEVWTDANSPLGQTELIPAFNYTDVVPGSDSYVPLPGGDYVFDVAVDGAGPGTLYTSPALNLSAGSEFTAIAAGLVGATPAFTLLATEDNNRSVITQASVKVVHGAPAAGTVNVFVTPAGQFSAADVENGLAGEPLLENFEFGAITDYVAVAPGNYDIRVVPLSLGVAAINEENVALPEGLVATVLARQPNDPGSPSGTPAEFGIEVLTN